MTTYQYRCDTHGDTDVQLRFGTATPSHDCPACGAAMARVYAAPMLGLGSRAAIAALDRSAASAENPAVVTGRPRARPAAPTDPRQRRLPRP